MLRQKPSDVLRRSTAKAVDQNGWVGRIYGVFAVGIATFAIPILLYPPFAIDQLDVSPNRVHNSNFSPPIRSSGLENEL